RLALVGEDFVVGEPGRVLDADVHELPAELARPAAAAALVLALAVADHAMTRAADPTELLDVEVQQLAGPLALVAVRRLELIELAELPEPGPAQHRRRVCPMLCV